MGKKRKPRGSAGNTVIQDGRPIRPPQGGQIEPYLRAVLERGEELLPGLRAGTDFTRIANRLIEEWPDWLTTDMRLRLLSWLGRTATQQARRESFHRAS